MAHTTQDLDLTVIEAEIAEVSGVLNVAHGRLVELTGRAIDGDLWRGYGIRSVEHWLTIRAGLSYRTARQVAVLARRRAELPTTTRTLHDGELTLDQAAAVAELAPTHTDRSAASLARVTTVSQLRSTLSRYSFAETTAEAAPTPGQPDPTPTPAITSGDDRERDALRAGSASVWSQGVRFRLYADGPVDSGAVVEQALIEAKDALFRAGQPEVNLYDALVEMAQRSLSGVASVSRRERYRVVVHLDTAGSWLNAGPAVPPSMLDKLCCDGLIAPLWETQGTPVSVGRALRVVPIRTRRVVEDRDRLCRFPGCGASRHLEVHHVLHWRYGGRTDTGNLAALCPVHHDAHHRGEFTITGDADDPAGLTFIDPSGRRIGGVTPPRPPPTDAVLPGPRGDTGYRPPTGERLAQQWVYFPPTPPGAPTTAA